MTSTTLPCTFDSCRSGCVWIIDNHHSRLHTRRNTIHFFSFVTQIWMRTKRGHTTLAPSHLTHFFSLKFENTSLHKTHIQLSILVPDKEKIRQKDDCIKMFMILLLSTIVLVNILKSSYETSVSHTASLIPKTTHHCLAS